ncbi:MAG: TM1812 family CRISPR-associated protein [bacterium]|nr:TM1812 family CRISPR-associated protein [bacterium]
MTQKADVGSHLICSVGTGKYDGTTYRRGQDAWSTRYAPVALARLLRLGGSRATVLVTREAQAEHYGVMARELEDSGLTVAALEIPKGESPEEILTILDRLMSTVGAGDKVILDVTFALRHLPFIYFTALTYLTAQRGVQLEGIFYGLRESGRLVDLTPLFRLVKWYHALQMVHDTGDLRLLAWELGSDVGRLGQASPRPQAVEAIKEAAAAAAEALASGLPVEVGMHTRLLLEALEGSDLAGSTHGSLLALDNLKNWAEQWAVAEPVEDKADLRLAPAELERQLRLARWYIERYDAPKALSVLREWLVSAVFLCRYPGNTGWLNRRQRKQAESLLNGLAQRARERLLQGRKHQKQLADTWNQLGELRNRLAHCGMTTHPMPSTGPVKLKRILAQCEALWKGGALRSLEPLPAPTRRRRVLVSCLGFSPGVLYSAVVHAQPAQSVIVTSAQARSQLEEALDRAGCRGLPCHVLELQDPYSGFAEGISLMDAPLLSTLSAADELMVNITGGTTIMQYLVERIARQARRLGVPSRVVAVVDRRSPELQRAEPYVCGDLIELEGSHNSRDYETGTCEGE